MNNYIKQCKGAEEIQKVCQYKAGDYIWGKIAGTIVLSEDIKSEYIDSDKDFYVTREETIRKLKKRVWLPTQEQLQEMLRPKLDPITLLYLIDRFVASGEGYWHSFIKAPYPNPSMNELWLAFVMKEKYNKVWNGKEWI